MRAGRDAMTTKADIIVAMNRSHAAEAVFAAHILFIVLALVGGFGVLVTRWWLLVHLPIVAWSAYVNLANRTCPLTPLESGLRGQTANSGLDDGFIVHHVGRHLRPGSTPQQIEHLVGGFIIVWNLLVYALVWWWAPL